MSFLDWLARKQRRALSQNEDVSVDDALNALERKVIHNAKQQIHVSSFQSVKQRDSLVMQRVLGQQPAKGGR